MSYSFTNYNYVGNTIVSVLIKKTYANKCTLSEIFLTEILDISPLIPECLTVPILEAKWIQ